MIIRRIRQHVSAQDWFAVGIDLLIAILGVFIGIQVSNWNQARLDRNQGGEYRLRLIQDMRANESDLRDRKSYYSAVRDHASAALAAFDRPAGPDDALFLIHAYEASQITPRKLKRFTYDEILARGAMQWVGDAALREKIDNYYVGLATTSVTYDAVPPYRERIREIMPSAAQEAVRRDCPERVYFTAEGAGQAQLAQNCTTLRLDTATITLAAATVRADPTLKRELTRQIADHEVKLRLIDATLGQRGKLRQEIAAANGT